METRPCHYASSRIHTLTCGHTIAVTRDAEPCATNCTVPITLTSTCLTHPVPAHHAPSLEKIRNSIVDGVNAYAATFRGTDDWLDGKVERHVDVLRQIWARQEQRILAVPDLVGGDFGCSRCGVVGARMSFPAFTLAEDPYFCIVVARNLRDFTVLAELEKGVLLEPIWKERGGRVEGRTNRQEFHFHQGIHSQQQQVVRQGPGSAQQFPSQYVKNARVRKVKAEMKNARVTQARVEEKERIIGQLRDETLLEEVEALGFGL
jgi:hypothetical protein